VSRAARPLLEVVPKPEAKHGKKCGCPPCLQRRLREWDERVEAMFKPRMPADVGQCIPVRGHFRRSKKYLKRDPKFRELVLAQIQGLVEENDE
jgi:hypothetical protein